MRRLLYLAVFTSCALSPFPARAQLWSPTQTKPKPNLIVGFDSSVTMQIDTACSACHGMGFGGNPAIGWTETRLSQATQDILQTLPLFKDLFVFGFFDYRACGSAKIMKRVLPDIHDPERSFSDTLAVIEDLRTNAGNACYDSERQLPDGSRGPPSCLTPGCGSDVAVLASFADAAVQGRVAGLKLPSLPPAGTTTTCSKRPGTLDPATYLADILKRNPPRWNGRPSGVQVQWELCNPLQEGLAALKAELASCLNAPDAFATIPSSYLPPASNGPWCTPGTVANAVCGPAPLLGGTCVCDPGLPGCAPSANASACGIPMVFKARQQVAICETFDTSSPERIGSALRAQPDNVMNGQCRQNASLFFTDGYAGAMPGVPPHGAAAAPSYRSLDQPPVTNAFVFRISDVFTAEADAMQNALSQGAQAAAFDAESLEMMQESFAQIVNRVLRGVYSGSNLTVDRSGTFAVFHTFTIPGRNAHDPSLPQETYYGWPSRLSFHSVDPSTGKVDPAPICETDWAPRVQWPPLYGWAGGSLPADTQILGPEGDFFSSKGANPRVKRIQPNTMDRTGDGRADNHPELLLGYMFGGSATQPVIVEAAHDVPPQGSSAAAYAAYQMATRSRPRTAYVLSAGYLHAYFAGAPNTSPFNLPKGVKLEYSYDTSGPNLCKELFRYRPRWMDAASTPGYSVNPIIQQRLLDGQISVREVEHPPRRFRTVLVFTQGPNGRGVATLDVTNPARAGGPQELGAWLLPAGATATSEPMIYKVGDGAGGSEPRVILSGGAGGTAALYSYSLEGVLKSQIALPGGPDFPTSPVCLDARGKNVTTDCYVLSRKGDLIRVRIDGGGAFTSPVNLTTSRNGIPITPGQQFWTRPVIYFGDDNVVNVVFGSGDVKNLESNRTVVNSVYRVKDNSNRVTSGSGDVTLDGVCTAAPGVPSKFDLVAGPGEALISPPVVAKGVVAWTTYTPGTNGCASGKARLYAMDYERCSDARTNSPTSAPAPEEVGDGLPSSPSILRGSQTILTRTSGEPTTAQTTQIVTKGGDRSRILPIYWRNVTVAR